ncbi:glucoamylase family protein [Algoriphagus boritolerans]|uniref:glucoamylase family protein n=1 Tax=Algoriphagus boritolerans TaxID=308111 RepID=UPI000A462185
MGLKDRYADYEQENRNHTLINRAWCLENPGNFKGYGESLWGLTASYSINFYNAHHPGNDTGVISPTAAVSSIPYTPKESMEVIKNLYYNYGKKSPWKIWILRCNESTS